MLCFQMQLNLGTPGLICSKDFVGSLRKRQPLHVNSEISRGISKITQ